MNYFRKKLNTKSKRNYIRKSKKVNKKRRSIRRKSKTYKKKRGGVFLTTMFSSGKGSDLTKPRKEKSEKIVKNIEEGLHALVYSELVDSQLSLDPNTTFNSQQKNVDHMNDTKDLIKNYYKEVSENLCKGERNIRECQVKTLKYNANIWIMLNSSSNESYIELMYPNTLTPNPDFQRNPIDRGNPPHINKLTNEITVELSKGSKFF